MIRGVRVRMSTGPDRQGTVMQAGVQVRTQRVCTQAGRGIRAISSLTIGRYEHGPRTRDGLENSQKGQTIIESNKSSQTNTASH